MAYEKDYTHTSSYTDVMQMTMTRVFGWMGLALLLSAASALFTISSPALLSLIYGNQLCFFGLIIGELGLVIYLNAKIRSLSFSSAAMLFAAYSILNGIMLSSVLLIYEMQSIYSALLATSLTFGAMSLYGATTRNNLSSLGSYLIMGLIGVIIASVVNIFLASTGLDRIISYVAVFLFMGLTAYDTQKIRSMIALQNSTGTDVSKFAIIGALSLYLDFVNLFLYILRLFGKRR